LFGVRYDIFKSFCIYKNLFSEGFGKSIKECFPFEIENISEYFLRNFRSEKRLEHLLYGLIGQIEMLYSSLAR